MVKTMVCSECREEKKYYAKGLCKACYCVNWAKENPEKQWHRRNPEKLKERNRRWREEHLEENRASALRWREENPDGARENARRWREMNPERHAAGVHRYRANKRGLPCTLTDEQAKEIIDRGICYYCGTIKGLFHLEHKVPAFDGGGFTEENIVCACATCNYRKGVKSVEEFMRILGRDGQVESDGIVS